MSCTIVDGEYKSEKRKHSVDRVETSTTYARLSSSKDLPIWIDTNLLPTCEQARVHARGLKVSVRCFDRSVRTHNPYIKIIRRCKIFRCLTVTLEQMRHIMLPKSRFSWILESAVRTSGPWPPFGVEIRSHPSSGFQSVDPVVTVAFVSDFRFNRAARNSLTRQQGFEDLYP